MKRTMGCAALLAAVVTVAPLHLDAQQGPGGRRGMAMGPRGAGVEMIMRQRERLQLTEDQVERLDAIRREAVQRRAAHQTQMAELRSRVAAGEMEPGELREQAQAMRQGAEEIQRQQRERIEAVLTDAQKETLQEWGARARAFQMGRQSALRGGGRGGMGPGMGPGMRPGRAPRGGAWQGFDGGMRQRWAPGMRGRPGMRRGPGDGMGFGPPGEIPPK